MRRLAHRHCAIRKRNGDCRLASGRELRRLKSWYVGKYSSSELCIVAAGAVAYPRHMLHPATKYAERFRGFLPVVVDIETGGFDSDKDALLEIAAVIIRMDEGGLLHPDPVVSTHVVPFP